MLLQHLKGILCHFPGGRGSESGREIYDKKNKNIYIYIKEPKEEEESQVGGRKLCKKKKKKRKKKMEEGDVR